MRIGWIGLGKMGEPMAMNILRAGHDLTVWNRSPEKCKNLRAAGAQVARDMKSLAANVDILFVMLSDDAALQEVVLGANGVLAYLPAGSVLVEMSTVSVAVSAAISEVAKAKKIQYLSAPVSGSVALAAAGELTILASGNHDTYQSLQPVLLAISAAQFYVGEADHARVLKLAINMMVGFSAAMMGEALSLGLKNGLDRTTMLEVMGASVIASPLIGYKLEALKACDYSPMFDVSQMAKDFDLALEAGRDSDTPMPLAALVREGWSALIASGDGKEDFFKYVEMAARSAGLHNE
ncbi:NAD(P)-dependent oxidoreductase [Tropicibacter sp. Alg240-R139]|uniref:NAD(P)-dependent oxidoreductase n=1 Tax=Tropicibacter sp. Alg240-R139 TaxID=2305991 RepID=UPI002102C965|nr:NAD(P)-dependent oxidoreductase [Tropicibacter sp. Alg240-R139]